MNLATAAITGGCYERRESLLLEPTNLQLATIIAHAIGRLLLTKHQPLSKRLNLILNLVHTIYAI